MPTIAKLEAAYRAAVKAEVEANAVTRAAQDAWHRQILAEWHIQPGDIIKNEHGTLALVTRTVVQWEEPSFIAVPQKSNGSFGKRKVTPASYPWRDATLHAKAGVKEGA